MRSVFCALSSLALSLPLIAGEPGTGYDITRVVELHDSSSRGVGSWIPDAEFVDLDGNAGRLSDFAQKKALVVVMRDITCPIAGKMGPETAAIEKAYAEKGVAFLYVTVSTTDSPEAIRESQDGYGMKAPIVHDTEGAIASAFGPMTGTEVFVFDPSRTLRYRGAITDRYGVGAVRPGEARGYLVEALDAVLAGGTVARSATTAPGCLLEIEREETRPEGEAPTWHREISRIVQNSCVECHRADGIGPFPLESYEDAAGRSAMMKFVVGEGYMPPWHAAPGTGPWVNDRSLPREHIDAVLAWIEAGAPEGDPAEAPIARTFEDTAWQIGEPDLVLEIDEDIRIPASGTVDYVYRYIETGLTREKWVEAVEIRTEAPTVMHHALAFVEKPRQEGENDRRFFRRWNGGAEGYFAGLVPGQGPTEFQEGMGMRLGRKSWLKFQLHYTPDGTARTDRVRIGFRFADEKPETPVQIVGVYNDEFSIPAGASGVEVVATEKIKSRRTILGFSPHMHLRGVAYKYELTTPGGETSTILDVPAYDFDWQHFYTLAEPLLVERDSVITCTAIYDNSEGNPLNPDPESEVGFGEQTWDEMMIGYYMYHRSPKPLPGSTGN